MKVGRPASIECFSYSPPKWYFNDKLIIEGNRVLRIDYVKESDGGKYVCEGKNKKNELIYGTSYLITIGKQYR